MLQKNWRKVAKIRSQSRRLQVAFCNNEEILCGMQIVRPDLFTKVSVEENKIPVSLLVEMFNNHISVEEGYEDLFDLDEYGDLLTLLIYETLSPALVHFKGFSARAVAHPSLLAALRADDPKWSMYHLIFDLPKVTAEKVLINGVKYLVWLYNFTGEGDLDEEEMILIQADAIDFNA